MEINFNDKSEFGLKVLKFLECKKSSIIYEDKKIYFYNDNFPNCGKRCNAKGRQVTEDDILNYDKA